MERENRLTLLGIVAGLMTVLWYVVFLGFWPGGPGLGFMLFLWSPLGYLFSISTIVLGSRAIFVYKNIVTVILGILTVVLGLSWFFGPSILQILFET